jgi:hypothetical protein
MRVEIEVNGNKEYLYIIEVKYIGEDFLFGHDKKSG